MELKVSTIICSAATLTNMISQKIEPQTATAREISTIDTFPDLSSKYYLRTNEEPRDKRKQHDISTSKVKLSTHGIRDCNQRLEEMVYFITLWWE